MTDPSATPTQLYRLRTFGTLALAGPRDDTVLGKHGHHRRRLALLAVLAASGERGRSRDQLLLLFWPEATQSRARHSLDQLLYALRNSVGESVFVGTNPVGLNPCVVGSDVGAFTAALDRGELETAVEEYRGPFLDGFYLEDAPEFERWVETERARLAACYSGALERLAQRAEAAQDHVTAVRWWRQLAATDPVSGKYAAGLIRALMNGGDHPAALQYAERYEAVVAQELGTSVGPAIANLVAEVRATATSDSVTIVKSSPRPAPPIAPVSVDFAPVDRRSPRASRPRRSLRYLIGSLALAVVVIGAGVWRATVAGNTRQPPGAELSIAVLPFANVSRDPQDAVFVDGLSEELIAALTKIRNLRVIARTSAFAFKGSDAGARRIADSLGVSYLLEGSAEKVGSKLRVQVRLVDGRDGLTRWSETYDREMRDVFVVQSDIAGAVARSLDLQLGGSTLAGIRRGPTPSIAAHDLYLRGNDPTLMRSDSAARTGLEYFRQAIALDPSYAAAYAGIARMYLRLSESSLSRPDRGSLAEQAALKALSLDDSLGDAHASLSFIRRRDYDLAGARSELERAVSLEPRDARFHEWLAQLLANSEHPSEALAEARLAVSLDPLSPGANAEIARALAASDRCDEALVQLATLKSLRPPLPRAGNIAAQCYARKGMWPEAIAELQRIPANAKPSAGLLGYMLARGGRAEEARRILASLLDPSLRIKGSTFNVGMVYAGLGEKDSAFQWLDKATEDRSFTLENARTILDGLRPDPRVDRIRRRLGLQNR